MLLAFRLALMLMLRCAPRVSWLADQETSLLTKISPLPLVDASVAMLTLVLPLKALDKVLEPMPEVLRDALPAAIVKSIGSISQVPVLPVGAVVVTRVPSTIFTVEAEVSIKPPLPPSLALASSVPPTLTVPATIPASRMMMPSWFSTVCASITPVLLTTLASSASFAPALIKTMPPSARISPPFSTKLSSTLWSICMLTSLLPLKLSVTALPAPNATVPNGAVIVPWLLTVLPSRAT